MTPKQFIIAFVAITCAGLALAQDAPESRFESYAEQPAPTDRERAYAIWQFHSLDIPMMQYRYRFEREETEKKAKAGDVTMFMPMFFTTYLSGWYRPGDPRGQLDVCVAAYWLDLAVKNEAANAAYWMSQLYLTGNGVPQDFRKSYQWFLFWAATLGISAADLPLPPAYFRISDATALELQGDMNRWNALKEPDIPMRSCPGCAPTKDHLCKLAVSRKQGLEVLP